MSRGNLILYSFSEVETIIVSCKLTVCHYLAIEKDPVYLEIAEKGFCNVRRIIPENEEHNGLLCY
jgi:hypothetical protein